MSAAKEYYECADEHFGWAETARTERERAMFAGYKTTKILQVYAVSGHSAPPGLGFGPNASTWAVFVCHADRRQAALRFIGTDYVF